MATLYFIGLCANFGLGLYCGLKYKARLTEIWEQIW